MDSPGAVFLHRLPAHRGEEVSAEVADGPRSRIWTQAANRMHAARGLLVWLMAGVGVARLVGFALDGQPDSTQWSYLVAEVAMLTELLPVV